MQGRQNRRGRRNEQKRKVCREGKMQRKTERIEEESMQGRQNDNCCTAFPSREELDQCQNINPKHTFQSSYHIIYLYRVITILSSLHAQILTLNTFSRVQIKHDILANCLNIKPENILQCSYHTVQSILPTYLNINLTSQSLNHVYTIQGILPTCLNINT